MKKFLTKHKKALLFALEYGLLIAAAFLLYRLWARPAAIEFRGNAAIGGEIFCFALPLIYGGIKQGIKDIKSGIFRSENWAWED